ncbi:MAG TPA: creatininase family protein [Candidatus Nitrosotalea sp.]|nr:creatininase family protein [Candidatus Nitrosotalea sp.]
MIAKDLSNSAILREIRRRPVAIIPVGSTEQHGPHLPVSTDSDIVTFVARKVAKKKGFLLLPTIEFGVSYEHSPFFNLSASPRALQKYLADLCISLRDNGVRTVVVLNGHHGNLSALRGLPSRVAKSRHGPRVLVYSYWHFMKRRFDHAGFVETSIMRAISDRVEMGKAVRGLVEDDYTQKELKKLGRAANRSFIAVTKNGVWGDPRKATAAEGREILAEITESLIKESQTWLTAKR